MTAARDLLACHDRPLPPVTRGVLDWQQVTASAPVRAAMVSYAAGAAARTAAWLGSLPPSAHPPGCDVRRAAVCLADAQSAALHAETEWPVPAAGQILLGAVPVTALPPRRPPPGPGQPAEQSLALCEGITASAARLRRAARLAAAGASRSPAASAGAWRWTAVSGAIASDATEMLLAALDALPSAPPAAGLLAASRAMGAARQAWHEAAASWGQVSTDGPARESRPVTEARDLITRLGRLAFADPSWVPSQPRRGAAGRAADLPEDIAVPVVAAALHEAAEAIADLAVFDLAGIEAAWSASRFYVPARHPAAGDRAAGQLLFTPAPRKLLTAVTGAYREAVAQSARAAAAMGATAQVMGLPSQPLALARALGSHDPVPCAPQPAGRVEMLVTALSDDGRLRQRAAALDVAEARLAAQAAATGFPAPGARPPAGSRQSLRRALGAELRRLREQAGQSRPQLAAAAGTSVKVIEAVEYARGAAPPDVVRAAAVALAAPPEVVAKVGALADAAAASGPAARRRPAPARRRAGR